MSLYISLNSTGLMILPKKTPRAGSGSTALEERHTKRPPLLLHRCDHAPRAFGEEGRGLAPLFQTSFRSWVVAERPRLAGYRIHKGGLTPITKRGYPYCCRSSVDRPLAPSRRHGSLRECRGEDGA